MYGKDCIWVHIRTLIDIDIWRPKTDEEREEINPLLWLMKIFFESSFFPYIFFVFFQQVFRSAIDSSFLQQLQDWLTCSLPTFLSLNEPKAVWSLTVVLLSASINPHLMKLFPLVLNYGVRTVTRTNVAVAAAATTTTHGFADDEVTAKLGHHEIGMFVTSAQDFYMKLSKEQKQRFREAFKEFHHIKVYNKMLQSL